MNETNRMTCRVIIVASLLAFITLKCSKDNELELSWGTPYVQKEIRTDGKIHIYDLSGEIIGSNSAAEFRTNIESYSDYFLNSYIGTGHLDSVYFHNASEATVSSYGIRDSFVVRSDGNFQVLTGKHITDDISINAVCSEDFRQRISKYPNEILQNELASSVGGVYRFQCKIRQKVPFNTAGNVLTFSIFIYAIRDRSTNSYTTGTLYNELKHNFYKELDPGTEFAYQQLTVIYN